MSHLSYTISEALVKEYQGEKKQDKYHGTGLAIFHSGNTYNGEFQNGNFHGKGVHTWKDGVVYEGEFKENRIVGQGKYSWVDGCVYEGGVLLGKRHGVGTFKSENQAYEGGWKNGKPDGEGICKYQCGSVYRGEWSMGKKHGRGRMEYPSGNVYDGEWKENAKCGQGKMYWNDREEFYDGMWKDGKPHGSGEYIWRIKSDRVHQYPFHNIYRGEWVDGKRQGYGEFIYSSGAKYEGQWENNQKHGKGRYITQNGRVYEGMFEEDRATSYFETFSNQIPFQFRLKGDLDEESKRNVLVSLNSMVSRYAAPLRRFYEKYAQETCLLTKDETKHVLSRSIIWKILRDLDLLRYGHTISDLDRTYAVLFKGDVVYANRYHEPHNSATEFLYHDMLEYFIHISHTLFNNHPDLSVHETGLSATFEFLVKNHILEHLGNVQKEETPKDPCEVALQECYEQNVEQLESMYHQLAHHNPDRLPDSLKDVTFTYREFALMLKDYKILSSFQSVTMKEVIEQFQKLLPTVMDGGHFNLEREMTLTDFQLAVQLCSHLPIKPLIDRIHRLQTNGFEYDSTPIIITEKSTGGEDIGSKPSSVGEGRRSISRRGEVRKSIAAATLPPLPQQEKKKKETTKKPKQEEVVEVKEVVEEKVQEPLVVLPPVLTPEEIEARLVERYRQVESTVQRYYEVLIKEHKKFQDSKVLIEAATHRKQHRIALEHAAQLAKERFFKSQSLVGSKEDLDARKSAMDLAQVLIDTE